MSEQPHPRADESWPSYFARKRAWQEETPLWLEEREFTIDYGHFQERRVIVELHSERGRVDWAVRDVDKAWTDDDLKRIEAMKAKAA